MTYIMESKSEGQRIERKTNRQLTVEQLGWAGVGPGARVLDLGCAAGTTTRTIAGFVGSSGLAVGVDTSEERIEEARRYPSYSGRIEYRTGLAEAIPAADGEFDVAWSRFLFEYLREPRLAIAEMVRVTRPGGIVSVSDLDGNCVWLDPIWPELESELAEAIALLGREGFDPYAGRKLYVLARDAGLVDIRVDVRVYHLVAGAADPISAALWKMKLDTIVATLTRLGWRESRASVLVDAFLRHLSDSRTFAYSNLITVAGRKPEDV